jgi:formimidoylglutamate deiminase
MTESQVIQADWTWVDGEFKPDIQIVVTPGGRIEHVGTLTLRNDLRLTDRALIPGFVNAHSHAFQRGLRGRGEQTGDENGSFWTWRDEMYRLVDELDADAFYDLTLRAFREMLAAGITTVAEFHYLHHDQSCMDYRFDDLVLMAARDAGIRLVLLTAYYRTGGIGRPLSGAQKRFGTSTVEDYRRQLERLWSGLDGATQSIGVAAHSLRAVPPDDLVALHNISREVGMVFHLHIEEQRREIEECQKAFGKTPMALLNERLEIDHRVTAVHCTHTAAEDLRRFVGRGGNVCLCPLTEANLGDGLADVPSMLRLGANPCVGTDSNARVSVVEELRWLELGQRLEHELRGVLRQAEGTIGARLLGIATENGAKALGLPTGRIQPGHFADFAAIDLTSPTLAGFTPETLLDTLFFGADNEAIAAVCVGGRWTPAMA